MAKETARLVMKDFWDKVEQVAQIIQEDLNQKSMKKLQNDELDIMVNRKRSPKFYFLGYSHIGLLKSASVIFLRESVHRGAIRHICTFSIFFRLMVNFELICLINLFS